eukprot:TRINITY_DN57234_c0_g1_i1.p1 TRINITY_DN57234_c0_g1~~TRINITY_DN57234_c0_g1_i1.p1  ORF type:complete len:297 (+),score=78.78 TRINITY_DN57234_c0_g1_i1:68-958(+)
MALEGPAVLEGQALLEATQLLRQVCDALRAADPNATPDSRPARSPPSPPTPAPAGAVRRVENSGSGDDELATLRRALHQELERWCRIDMAAAKGDYHAGRQQGADDPALQALQVRLATALRGCIVGESRQVGITLKARAELLSILDEIDARKREFAVVLSQEECELEAELKLRLKAHESRMCERLINLQKEFDKHAEQDAFLNSAGQRAREREQQAADLIAAECARRRAELASESAEEEQRRASPARVTSVEDEREGQRKAEKLERLRQSEHRRAVRKGYSTDPDYQPPQEFKFGH